MSRPNILWIMADELRVNALGCYGGAWAKVITPNIDALAAGGVIFTNNFCNSPVCVPSRTSTLTAASPEQTGVYFNEGAWKSFPTPVFLPTFPELFAANGYRTASIGKSHYARGYKPFEDEKHDGSSMHGFGLETNPAELEPIVPIGIPSPIGGVFPPSRPYPPEAVTRNAVKWLSDHDPAHPFLLRVSYLQPHTPVLPPSRYRELYRAADWPGGNLPRGYGSRYENLYADIVGGRDLTHAQLQQAQADYHALVTWLDEQVGQVLATLRSCGLDSKTVVVFTSDHGASLGENGLFGKVVFSPQSHRTPLILSFPGHIGRCERRDDLTENLDLARTLCDLTDIAPNPDFAGRSVLSGPAPDAIYATAGTGALGARASAAANRGNWENGGGWPRRLCVRTARYRFDMNVRQDGRAIAPAEEDAFLADVVADPAEHVNLATDHAYTRLAADLRAKVLEQYANSIEPDFVPAFNDDEAPEFSPPRIA